MQIHWRHQAGMWSPGPTAADLGACGHLAGKKTAAAIGKSRLLERCTFIIVFYGLSYYIVLLLLQLTDYIRVPEQLVEATCIIPNGIPCYLASLPLKVAISLNAS